MQIHFLQNKGIFIQILLCIGFFCFIAVAVVILLPLILILLLIYPFTARAHFIWNLRNKMKNPFSNGNDGGNPKVSSRSFDNGDTVDVDATVVSSEETGNQQGDGSR